MSLLSDSDIRKALDKDIVIEPFVEENLTPIGYDFTVGDFLYSLEQGLLEARDEGLLLPPKNTVQILTRESLWVSSRIAGTFHSKVSLVSKGLSHISTTLDPGWYGPLLITLRNNTNREILIESSETFVTLLFYRVTPAEGDPWKPEYRKDILMGQMDRVELDRQTASYIRKIQSLFGNTEALAEFKHKVEEKNQAMISRIEALQDGNILRTIISEVVVKIKKLDPEVRLPIYEHDDDSGADLYAMADYELLPGERQAVATGLQVETPPGYEIQIRPKSGLAINHGITVLNTPGTIDAGYRGEVKVILANLSSKPYSVVRGQKVAQMVVCPIMRAKFEEVAELSSTARGEGGLGSTGIGS